MRASTNWTPWFIKRCDSERETVVFRSFSFGVRRNKMTRDEGRVEKEPSKCSLGGLINPSKGTNMLSRVRRRPLSFHQGLLLSDFCGAPWPALLCGVQIIEQKMSSYGRRKVVSTAASDSTERGEASGAKGSEQKSRKQNLLMDEFSYMHTMYLDHIYLSFQPSNFPPRTLHLIFLPISCHPFIVNF